RDFKGNLRQLFLAPSHEHNVQCDAQQPGRKRGFSTEGVNLAEQCQECFLRYFFGISGIASHAKTKTIDTPFVGMEKCFESLLVTSLCALYQIGVRSESRSWMTWFLHKC